MQCFIFNYFHWNVLNMNKSTGKCIPQPPVWYDQAIVKRQLELVKANLQIFKFMIITTGL